MLRRHRGCAEAQRQIIVVVVVIVINIIIIIIIIIINRFLNGRHPVLYLIFNTMVYSVLTHLQYISFLATCFGFYKTIFRAMLTIGKYSQCVHTLWDPIVFTLL